MAPSPMGIATVLSTKKVGINKINPRSLLDEMEKN